MNKKWKILLVLLVMLMTYSIVELSKKRVQVDIVNEVISPYSQFNEPYQVISILGADDTQDLKQTLVETSQDTGVSLIATESSKNEKNTTEYYWNIQNEKYLPSRRVLNREIDLETFNGLKEPISNQRNAAYFFDMPSNAYSYRIYPLTLYDESSFSSSIIIFAETEQQINAFLTKLNEKDLVYEIHLQFPEFKSTFYTILRFAILENPLMLLTFTIYLIATFTYLYRERRNLTIKLVNGYSKLKYILEFLRTYLSLLIKTIFASFLIIYFISYSINMRFFQSLLYYSSSAILIIICSSSVLVILTVYSFTDINNNSYVKGIKKGSVTPIIIGGTKLVLSFIVCLLLSPTIDEIISSVAISKSIREKTNAHSNVYVLDSSGDYGRTITYKSDDIVRELRDFKNMIYISPAYISEGREFVFHVNENYLKWNPLKDKNGKAVFSEGKNVVYTQDRNNEKTEHLKRIPWILCESEEDCTDIKMVVLDDISTINLYKLSPHYTGSHTTDDFILVLNDNPQFILQYLFIFEDETQIQEVTNRLANVIDIELIRFVRLTDQWSDELDIYRSTATTGVSKILSYILTITIITYIYYQIKFDKIKRDFSIYWVNGISKFHTFFFEYLYQIVLNTMMVVLIKQFMLPEISSLNLIILILVFISIDTITIIIFRHLFYAQLQKHIKEEV